MDGLWKLLAINLQKNLHQTGTNPLSLQTIHDDETVSFILNLLNEKACSEIEPLIMDDALERIKLRTGEQKEFQILEKRVYEMSEKKLSQIFYANDCNNVLKLKIVTPTAFKTNGKYLFFPDIRMMFQNIMRKYNCIFENTEDVDLELLDEICNKVEIAAYNVRSRRFYLHKAYVNGFQGYLTLVCHGSQTLTNYVAVLLKVCRIFRSGSQDKHGYGCNQTIGRSRFHWKKEWLISFMVLFCMISEKLFSGQKMSEKNIK